MVTEGRGGVAAEGVMAEEGGDTALVIMVGVGMVGVEGTARRLRSAVVDRGEDTVLRGGSVTAMVLGAGTVKDEAGGTGIVSSSSSSKVRASGDTSSCIFYDDLHPKDYLI